MASILHRFQRCNTDPTLEETVFTNIIIFGIYLFIYNELHNVVARISRLKLINIARQHTDARY